MNVATALKAGSNFHAVSEKRLANGHVIDKFSNGKMTVSVYTTHGATLDLTAAAGDKVSAGSLHISYPKSSRPPVQGNSAVAAAIALGMDPQQAQETFGELDHLTPVGTSQAPAIASAAGSGKMAGSSSGVAAALAAVTLSSTPYRTDCLAINSDNGHVTGQGCTNTFLEHQSGSDWWLITKSKLSAHSNDTATFFPDRLTQLGWYTSWGNYNYIYDWSPAGVQPVSSTCKTVTSTVSSPYGSYSNSSSICPDDNDLYSLDSSHSPPKYSGEQWNGTESGTSYENTVGEQSVHSPSNAWIDIVVSYHDSWN